MPNSTSKRRTISQPYITREVTLHSDHAQRAFRRVYKSVSDSFYLMGIVFRIIGSKEEVEGVETLVNDLLKDTKTDLQNEMARLTKLCDDNGIDVDLNFTEVATMSARITSPRGAEFLAMIEEADRVIMVMSTLWLSAIFDDSQYSAMSYMWQRRLVKLAGRIRNITATAISKAKSGPDQELKTKIEESIANSGVDLDAPIDDEEDDDQNTEQEGIKKAA